MLHSVRPLHLNLVTGHHLAVSVGKGVFVRTVDNEKQGHSVDDHRFLAIIRNLEKRRVVIRKHNTILRISISSFRQQERSSQACINLTENWPLRSTNRPSLQSFYRMDLQKWLHHLTMMRNTGTFYCSECTTHTGGTISESFSIHQPSKKDSR